MMYYMILYQYIYIIFYIIYIFYIYNIILYADWDGSIGIARGCHHYEALELHKKSFDSRVQLSNATMFSLCYWISPRSWHVIFGNPNGHYCGMTIF